MLINLTPHALNILGQSIQGQSIHVTVLPPSGRIARVSTSSELAVEIDGISVFRQSTGNVEDLPPPANGDYYIVSAMVRLALPERKDLLSPGALLRNTEGQPIGCNGLVTN